MTTRNDERPHGRAFIALFLASLCACEGDDGDRGPAGPAGTGIGPTSTVLDKDEVAPRVVVTITGVSGASGATGNFEPGDTPSVTFTLAHDDGSPWGIDELSLGRALVSGPTFNYQRVLAEATNVRAASVQNADGSWTYTFASPIPATYLPPLNDTAAFGADDGELAGQALLDGTYTVGLYFGWSYLVDGDSEREVGEDTFDFLLGPTAVLESRQVVKSDNCNRCHGDLQAHGGSRQSAELCLLCHTAGAEDRNVMSAAGGTPGASIDFRIMIHRIHNGAHLPSVVGMTTDVNGARDYTAASVPYELVGFNNNVLDFSGVLFPAWPNFDEPMPRDAGHALLSGPNQTKEDTVRRGVTSCYLCHGDPDGTGGLTAPAQGDLAFAQPSRGACASCHDDWIPELPYVANGETMDPQLSDGACLDCHAVAGDPLATRDAHLHPLLDPSFATGFHLAITDVVEAGVHDMDGTVDPGEKIAFTFTVQDDAGNDVPTGALNQINFSLNGPTTHQNILETGGIPLGMLTGAQPFTLNVPTRRYFEYVGDDAGGLQAFPTSFAPHWNVTGAATEVRVRTGLGAGSTNLAQAVAAPVNFVDVVDATGFLRNDFVVIDDGIASREYLQIQTVEGNRLWFSSPGNAAYPPGPLLDHPMGAAVEEVTTSVVSGASYMLDAPNGTVTELVDFANGDAVLVTYTTDLVLPARYPLAINAGPDLTEVQGGWAGKSLVDGTYTLTLWGRLDRSLPLLGETTTYRDLAEGESFDFLVGNAAALEPYDKISSASNCYACHVGITFHGRSRRGFATCIACHGNAASGDRTRYVAADAPETAGVTIDFAQLVHKLHRGADLANPSTYVVVGFGNMAYPANFSEITFEEVHFPSLPSGVKDCAICHGTGDAFEEPFDFDHPTEQGAPGQEWRLVCGSCHDSATEAAHFDTQTSATTGEEACALCHGANEEWSVPVMHTIR